MAGEKVIEFWLLRREDLPYRLLLQFQDTGGAFSGDPEIGLAIEVLIVVITGFRQAVGDIVRLYEFGTDRFVNAVAGTSGDEHEIIDLAKNGHVEKNEGCIGGFEGEGGDFFLVYFQIIAGVLGDHQLTVDLIIIQ